MSAALRLEDFAAPPRPRQPVFSESELRDEYQRGFACGADACRDAELTALNDALSAATARIAVEDQIRNCAIEEVLQAIRPVLQAIVAKLAERYDDVLAQAIADELDRLCKSGTRPACQIAAEGPLFGLLEEKIAELGLRGITLRPGAQTEITFDGGRISFGHADLPVSIAELLGDLSPFKER
ncbi:hypothetical protein FQV27_12755 [Paracoccus aurantiacus]|uniref:Flagellar assembly protein FliH/Type III secretion system HrpE domain-containing protein n=1 Tax=Paracoccus aurantiacus TaxID=2599412 RepID=A0A5C6S353_9RHOB|nr:hypothetical protein [Paracoccus aurantiacus]TXB68052.1 hypothetical protein FQV27_12755 [Paracoccus aurantiacus]